MRSAQRLFVHAAIILAVLSLGYGTASAQDAGFKTIRQHLKNRYQAKKKSIPFLGFAKFAVRLVKPAGVKSFNLTLFEDLKNTNSLPDSELSALMRGALSPEWQPLVSVRSRKGEQVYVYAMEAGKDIKLAVLVINQTEAALARVKLSPESLRKFVDNPKILGISLGSGEGDGDNNTADNNNTDKNNRQPPGLQP